MMRLQYDGTQQAFNVAENAPVQQLSASNIGLQSCNKLLTVMKAVTAIVMT
jgi:hypothetical protein